MFNLSGEEMAKMMKPGVRVIRGKDWEYANQDGNGPGVLTNYICRARIARGSHSRTFWCQLT